MTDKKEIVEEGKQCYVCNSKPRTNTLKSKRQRVYSRNTYIYWEEDVKQFLKQDMKLTWDFIKGKISIDKFLSDKKELSGFTEEEE